MRIGRKIHTKFKEMLIKADIERKLMEPVKKKHFKLLGHCISKYGMENLALTGKIAGEGQ